MIRAPQVWHWSVVVVPEVCCSTRADIPKEVHPFLCPVVPVKLSGDQGTGCSLVPLVQGGGGEVVMLPLPQHLLGDGVEVVSGVFVAIIVVVPAGEAVTVVLTVAVSISPSDVPGVADVVLHLVLPVQLAHVVNHLVVEVCVVGALIHRC